MYLRRNSHHSDAFKMKNYLNSLGDINSEDDSSEPESQDSETKGTIGADLILEEITGR